MTTTTPTPTAVTDEHGVAARIDAAAARLEQISGTATGPAWQTVMSAGCPVADPHGLAVATPDGRRVVGRFYNGPDARLAALLRGVPAVLVPLLRDAAARWRTEVRSDTGECPSCADGYCSGHGEVTAHDGYCAGDVLWDGKPVPADADLPDYDRCGCFAAAFALADLILEVPAP